VFTGLFLGKPKIIPDEVWNPMQEMCGRNLTKLNARNEGRANSKEQSLCWTKYMTQHCDGAKYEILSDDNSFYGEIPPPGFDGVYPTPIRLKTPRRVGRSARRVAPCFVCRATYPYLRRWHRLAIKEVRLMRPWSVKRDDLIRCLKKVGFDGPYSGRQSSTDDQGQPYATSTQSPSR